MSIEEQDLPQDLGPHLFTKQEIREVFDSDFKILDIKSGVFIGTLDTPPKAWFVIMKKK